MNGAIDFGAIPAKVSDQPRAKVTAGLANEVDEVKKYAAPIQQATKFGIFYSRF